MKVSEMKIKATTVPIDELYLASRNVRKHPTKQIEALKESYRLFGQYRPLVADSDGQVLVGNGMLKALQELGVGEVEVKFLPADFPEAMKKKLMLADNKTQSLGVDDLMAVEEFIIDIGDFEIPGFDSDVLEDLYGDSDFMEDYGTLPAAQKSAIKEVEAKREGGSEPVSAPQYIEQIKDEYSAQEATESQRHSGNYVTCPNCGMKIWQ